MLCVVIVLLMTQNGVHDAACAARLCSYMTENSAEYPWLIGETAGAAACIL